jgi:hypothetical protein
MAEKEFNWSSREDIRREFRSTISNSDALDSHNNMIPWCINNCALLPRYITGKDELEIGVQKINKVEDLKGLNGLENMDSLVEAVAEWVL